MHIADVPSDISRNFCTSIILSKGWRLQKRWNIFCWVCKATSSKDCWAYWKVTYIFTLHDEYSCIYYKRDDFKCGKEEQRKAVNWPSRQNAERYQCDGGTEGLRNTGVSERMPTGHTRSQWNPAIRIRGADGIQKQACPWAWRGVSHRIWGKKKLQACRGKWDVKNEGDMSWILYIQERKTETTWEQWPWE